jgi:hypothetical protein
MSQHSGTGEPSLGLFFFLVGLITVIEWGVLAWR